MNIVHVITGLRDGGAEGALYRLCLHDRANHHAVVSLMDEGKYGPYLREAGIQVFCLGMRRSRVSLSGLIHLYWLLRERNPDVVQTWMYHADLIGGVVSHLAGVHTVCWGIRHCNMVAEKTFQTTRIVTRLCATLSGFVPRAIVSCSERGVNYHQSLGYSKKKFSVIPNGYDLVDFAPDPAGGEELRRVWGTNEETPLIGMVARYNPQKDHKNLIRALQMLTYDGLNYNCVLIGSEVDDNNATLLESLTRHCIHGRVKLLGRRTDIPTIMNAIDIHVLSSAGEAFPNVLAEAMACGTPCVATDVGDAALIVGATGWIVPPANPRLLASAISEAISEWNDKQKWTARTFACREHVSSEFSLDRMTRDYNTIWKSVVDTPSKGT